MVDGQLMLNLCVLPTEERKRTLTDSGGGRRQKRLYETSDSAEEHASRNKRLKRSDGEFSFPKKSIEQIGSRHATARASSSGFVSSLFTRSQDVPGFEAEDYMKVNPRIEGVFGDEPFSRLGLHPFLCKALATMFEQPTRIQSMAIPSVLQGKDVLVKAQTGTGKTLIYVCTILHKLQEIQPKISRSQGTMALVLLPTKELARQTFEWFQKLSSCFNWIVPGLVIGIEKRKSEKAKIRKGLNVLVTTPGRLLDHLDSTQNLTLARLRFLVLDEADLLLEMGYQNQISQILQKARTESVNKELNPILQTILLSATLTPAVEMLACLALREDRVFADAYHCPEETEEAEVKLVTPTSLKHHFVFVPTKLRLVALVAFLVEKVAKKSEKVLVFFATQDLVDFHCQLFSILSLGLQPIRLHGKMEQGERMKAFDTFKRAKSALLLCTDVGSRGLDLPLVSWVVQCSAPSTLSSYLHRSGRTGRVGKKGASLLFLQPSEAAFLRVLQQEDIPLKGLRVEDILEELNCPGGSSLEGRATWLQLEAENLVLEDAEGIGELAKKAFTSFIRFYATYPRSFREAFNMRELHLGHVAKSLALRETPSQVRPNSFAPGAGRFERRGRGLGGSPSLEGRGCFEKMKRTSKVVGGKRILQGHPSSSSEDRQAFSEFDSGFDGIQTEWKKKKKRR